MGWELRWPTSLVSNFSDQFEHQRQLLTGLENVPGRLQTFSQGKTYSLVGFLDGDKFSGTSVALMSLSFL
jgi:hypothetical protein